jgi:hypothetical protein
MSELAAPEQEVSKIAGAAQAEVPAEAEIPAVEIPALVVAAVRLGVAVLL